jgi:hypothetical protein
MSDVAPAPQTVQSPTPENILATLLNLGHEINELIKQHLSGGVEKSDYESKLLILKKRRKESASKLRELLTSDPDRARQLRYGLYANRTAQFLLTGFAGGMIKELTPNFDSDRKARYPILENIEEAAPSVNPSEILDELAYVSILDKKLYERVACCPKCGSPSAVFLRIKCPECGSLQLESSKLIEHLVCGAVQEFDEFATNEQIRCPSCQESLTKEGEDYRVVGTFNRCESCHVHFDEPEKKFICRTCQEEFDIKDSTYYDTYAYTLNGNVLLEVKAIIGLPMFKTVLEEVGYSVELPGRVTGSSGMIHNFTLTGAKNGKTLAVDVVDSEGEVDEKELFAFYTKISDLKSTSGILIVIPRLSGRAKEFASKAFSRGLLTYIEAAGPPDAIEQLKMKLQEIG